jgi:hypothetical protein
MLFGLYVERQLIINGHATGQPSPSPEAPPENVPAPQAAPSEAKTVEPAPAPAESGDPAENKTPE